MSKAGAGGDEGHDSIVRIRVELADIEPKVVRVMEVPLTLRLDRLHLAIQAAMGWENRHLYQFEAGGTRWDMPDPTPGWTRETNLVGKATLADLVKAADTATADGPTAIYTYDFGDDWRHVLTIEATHEPVPGHLYPRLIEIDGRCPPEDVGGFPGYEHFLDAIADPQHPEHDDMLEWHGEPFDPAIPLADEMYLEVLKLGKKWKPRKR